MVFKFRLNPYCSWTWTSTDLSCLGSVGSKIVLILIVVGRGLVHIAFMMMATDPVTS